MPNTGDNTYYKLWQKGCTIIMTMLTIVAAIVTIINGWDQSIKYLSNIFGPILSELLVYINSLFLFPIAIICSIIPIVSYFTGKYRKNIGTHKIPCAFINLVYYKIANRHNKLLKSIHKNIYHSIYKLKDDIHMHRIRSLEEAGIGIEDLLYDIHKAILRSFGLDLTINIKMLILDRENNLCLIPFKHFRNIEERKGENSRAFKYCYYIEPDEYEKLSRYAAKAKQYYKKYGEDRKYEVNSIFTYLITKRKRYWMSNDLTLDEKIGDFYTSSDNYPEYYKSMAVFSLTPPDSDMLPEGLIIFDTKKTGGFSEDECVNLFGYIAHLFYELIIEYNHYESKKK